MKTGIFGKLHGMECGDPVYAVRTIYSEYENFPDAFVLRFDRRLPAILRELVEWEKENGVVSINPGFPHDALRGSLTNVAEPLENFGELNVISARKGEELFRAGEDEDLVVCHECRMALDGESQMLEVVFEAQDDYTRTATCHIGIGELEEAARKAPRENRKSALSVNYPGLKAGA